MISQSIGCRKLTATLIILAFYSITHHLFAQSPLRVMTFNIRLNTASDSLNAWPYRKDKVASQVLFHEVQLLGVQEALHDQVKDLEKRLPAFRYVGGGRDDGKEKGEYSAIFYDTTRFSASASGTFWLSLTPEIPGSKSWDAAITRIVTWARLTDLKNHVSFVAFNTHFDHMGKTARRESARLLLQKVRELAGTSPVVVTGDFNAEPWDEPIQVILNPSDPLHLQDSKSLSVTTHYGPTGSFNNFSPAETSQYPIDYIFLHGPWKVLNHANISETWNGRYASDHFAVMSTLVPAN